MASNNEHYIMTMDTNRRKIVILNKAEAKVIGIYYY